MYQHSEIIACVYVIHMQLTVGLNMDGLHL